ncbi:hypothetical protein ACHHV8_22310 [Paenibacillus sp. TAB 01]|uniref:hypothetical protein n=1 Tax=Paenibacillus sp. TAB 01 TaxID=3368988 RepID=UPI003750E2C1
MMESSRSKQFSGTGLGLPIARTILQNHNASFGLEAKAGTVTFYFSLPLVSSQPLGEPLDRRRDVKKGKTSGVKFLMIQVGICLWIKIMRRLSIDETRGTRKRCCRFATAIEASSQPGMADV